MDEVIVVLAGEGRVRLNVSQVFPDDTVLRDAYSGAVSMVSYGEVSFVASSAGVLLLERLE
jgi:alpha-amylase